VTTPSTDPIVGSRLFTDGAERNVYESPEGRQYVWQDAEVVYGQWLPPPDERVVVEGE
jgi:hypothetical protein